MHKKCYFSHWFLKTQIFSFLPTVKMNANYAESCMVGNLEADFQPVPLVHFFLKFSQYCCGTAIIQIQQEKQNYFLRKKI